MASIKSYKAKNGEVMWRVQYRKPDHSTTTKRGFSRKRDAEDWAARNVTTAINDGTYVDPEQGKALVGDLVTAWRDSHSSLWSAGSLKTNDSAIRVHVLPHWGGRQVKSIRHSEVQAWVNRLSSRRGPSVVLRAFGILKGAFELAYHDSMIASLQPVEGITLPHKPSRKEDRHYLSVQQLTQLADECGYYRDFVTVLGLTGIRFGEAAALRVGDLDFPGRRIHVRRSVSQQGKVGTPKSWEVRDVAMPQLVAERLETLVYGRPADAVVFPGRMGGVMPQVSTTTQNWWTSGLRKAGLPLMTVHDLRHTAASIAVSAGANVKVVQRMLGHKSAAMTLDVYSDLFDRDLDDVASRIDRLVDAGR